MSRKGDAIDIHIIYKPKKDNKDKTRIFGKKFVKNNKYKAKIIYNGNEYELKEYFEDIIHDDDKYEIRLILRIFEDIIDLGGMFSGCDCLYSFPDDGIIEENINNYQLSNSIEWKEESTNNKNFNIETKSSTKKNFLELLNTSKVTNMIGMFNGCKSLISLPDISKWDTSNVTNMIAMFYECQSLISLPDISKWNTSKVTNMIGMFNECNSLISIPDVSKWDTSKVTNMIFMLDGCNSLISLPDISKWNTSKVDNMSYMFNKCNSLISLPNISKWDKSKITNMRDMFKECQSLISLPDISK